MEEKTGNTFPPQTQRNKEEPQTAEGPRTRDGVVGTRGSTGPPDSIISAPSTVHDPPDPAAQLSQCYQQNPFKYKEPVTYFLRLNKSRRKVREVRLGGQPAGRQEAPRTRPAAQGSGRTEEIQ